MGVTIFNVGLLLLFINIYGCNILLTHESHKNYLFKHSAGLIHRIQNKAL